VFQVCSTAEAANQNLFGMMNGVVGVSDTFDKVPLPPTPETQNPKPQTLNR
jgi:hypothetical protein